MYFARYQCKVNKNQVKLGQTRVIYISLPYGTEIIALRKTIEIFPMDAE